MSYADFEATGTSVPFACSICGRRRLFPDQLVYSDDKLFRCTDACDERTAYNVDQQRAAWRAPPEPVPSMSGALPQGEIVTTFLQDAVDRRSQLIPGWTPTTTFQDDFTVLPGAVGSSWSVQAGSGGTVAAPSVGVARFSASGTSSQADAWIPTVSAAATGNFYCAASFSLVSVPTGSGIALARIGACTLSLGVPSSAAIAAGVRYPSVSASNYILTYIGSRNAISTVHMDAGVSHLAEMWWRGNGRVWAAIDGEVPISIVPAVATPWVALISAFATSGGAVSFDVTDYVAMV